MTTETKIIAKRWSVITGTVTIIISGTLIFANLKNDVSALKENQVVINQHFVDEKTEYAGFQKDIDDTKVQLNDTKVQYAEIKSDLSWIKSALKQN